MRKNKKIIVKSDVISHTCVFEKFLKLPFNDFDINPL